jgi:hypothetical protein
MRSTVTLSMVFRGGHRPERWLFGMGFMLLKETGVERMMAALGAFGRSIQ